MDRLPAACWPALDDGELMRIRFAPSSPNVQVLAMCGPQIRGRFRVGAKWVAGWFLVDTGASREFLSADAVRTASGPLRGIVEKVLHAKGEQDEHVVDAVIELEGRNEEGVAVTITFATKALAAPGLPATSPCGTVGIVGRDLLACGVLTYSGAYGTWIFEADVSAFEQRLNATLQVRQ